MDHEGEKESQDQVKEDIQQEELLDDEDVEKQHKDEDRQNE